MDDPDYHDDDHDGPNDQNDHGDRDDDLTERAGSITLNSQSSDILSHQLKYRCEELSLHLMTHSVVELAKALTVLQVKQF